MSKNKSIKKKKPGEKLNNISPEYDSVREQTVLLEHMNQSIQTIAEQHSYIVEKLDEHSKDMSVIKSEFDTVKLAIKDVDQRTMKIEQKLDAVTTDHERRITKIEERVLT